MNVNILYIIALSLLISACGNKPEPNTNAPTSDSNNVDKYIFINQLGYFNRGEKIVTLAKSDNSSFSIVNKNTNEIVYQGNVNESKSWEPAGELLFHKIDFSNIQTSGEYILRMNGFDDVEFVVDNNVYEALHDAALKYYYYNRASTDISQTLGGQWHRALGHLDQSVVVHNSASNNQRPEGTVINATKGWYDAGDFGKYVVNSGIATYTLMAAYEHYPEYYQTKELSIPESSSAVPDILDEIKWNLDWLATMQDSDGSVYHKLTTLDWPGKEMPNEDTRTRYVIGKSTTAALTFAANMAMASRIYAPFEQEFPNVSSSWLNAAELAWQWALLNPNLPYTQPEDVSSGEYGDSHFSDEFSWAAAELFITTQDEQYLNAFITHQQDIVTPAWQNVSTLGPISLLKYGKENIPTSVFNDLEQHLLSFADDLLSQYESSVFAVSMTTDDFVWGSNSVALNQAVILLQAYSLTQNEKYRNAALGSISYILGRNPTGYSYVTGFGTNTPLDPHHRTSIADGILAPIPGMLTGGPHSGQQDECQYPSNAPALSYIDDWCSYSTNEVAINWNAPLVYVLAGLSR